MLKDEERKELLKEADDAWIALERYVHEVMAPRFYKEMRARKMTPIYPWKDMKERMAAEEKEHELHAEWLHLFQRYIALAGERPYLPVLYRAQETPNGIRWIKREK